MGGGGPYYSVGLVVRVLGTGLGDGPYNSVGLVVRVLGTELGGGPYYSVDLSLIHISEPTRLA